MRVNKNITHKEQRQFSIDGFRGVDFASSPVACDPRRSPDAVNFIGDHGINRKRHGWEQCVRTGYENVRCIQQVSEDKIIEVTRRKILTIVKNDYGEWDYVADENGNAITTTIDSTESVTPVSFNGKMFFIGAGARYYDYESGDIKSIEEADYYIPTTTIDIDRVGVADQRAALDMPNLLTKLRKNTMRGYGGTAKYHLDGKLALSRRSSSGTDEYKPKNLQVEVVNKGTTYKSKDADYTTANHFIVKMYGLNNSGEIDEKNEMKSSDGKSALYVQHPWKNDSYDNVYGDVTLEFNIWTYGGGYQEAGGNTSPKDNIIVTYEPISDSSVINPYLGNIGCAFGIDGENDRLFLAGHPDHPNVIFFSEIDNPFYFPDQYTISVGSPNSKIVGMMRLNDGTMAVFKEPSESDVCLYYIKGSYRNEYDDAGNIKKILPVFSVSASPFYDAPISPHSALGFCGDSIFLSKNGIYAIEPEQNISADIRLARNRAAAVSPIFYNKKVVDATGIVYKNKCYFSYTLSDRTKGVLVADAAYKYVPEGEITYNYEWWYWDNVPAITFAIVDDELWFGTLGGNIFRFTDGYIDSYWNETGSGDIAFSKNNEGLNQSDNYLGDNEKIFYAKDASSLRNGRRVQFMTTAASGDKDLTGKNLYMCNVDKKNKTFQLSYYDRGNDVLTTDDPDLVDPITCNFDSTYSSIRMRFYQETPVKARWSTPPLDFGSSSILKSMRAMTVVAESGTNAKFRFGYETGKDLFERNMEGTGKFDLNNLNFADFSFDSGFQNAFTVRSHAHNFNFIRFHITSDEAAPCAVHRISAEYKFNKKNRGVN